MFLLLSCTFAVWWIMVSVGAGQFLLLAIILVLLAYLCRAARRERTPICPEGRVDVESTATERETVQLGPTSPAVITESAV